MRKILSALLVVLLATAIGSCGLLDERQRQNAVKEIKAQLDVERQNMPIDMGLIGTMQSIEFDDADTALVMTFEFNEHNAAVTVDKLGDRGEMMTKSIISTLNQDSDQTLKLLTEAKAGIRVNLIGMNTGKTASLKISPDKVRQIYEHPLTAEERRQNDAELLKNIIDTENARTPYDVDSGLTITRVFDEGNTVVYETLITSNLLSLDIIREHKVEIEISLRSYLNDPTTTQLLRLMASQGKSLTYRFTDGTDDHVDFEFNYSIF